MKINIKEMVQRVQNLGLGGASALMLLGAGITWFASPISQALAFLFKLLLQIGGIAIVFIALPIVMKKMPKKEDLIKEAKA
ncbi:MAG: hypothetical protein AABX70_05920 [Nanoarchaeota archaeon]